MTQRLQLVRGLLGHEYITQLGILYRDIGETASSSHAVRGGERECLIDLDTAIQEPEERTKAIATQRAGLLVLKCAVGLGSAADRLLRSTKVNFFLKKNWAGALHKCTRTLLGSLWVLFMDSGISPVLNLPRTKVNYSQSMRVLDIWSKKFSADEDGFSNGPFPWQLQ
ncbi:hypothetical protein PAXINDRAFT_21388 [Paxillus involutus ATCC 200175]|uniref:Uncharacterized protein n=1 Tax=Paxillus involutus ATCC 200175 TaxID=664439 RepID=A0A0C9TAU3_PAXIN|nr:hypothetical protein PAXINDRAFT_21388 [Paxillus involutus ATCC 200175]